MKPRQPEYDVLAIDDDPASIRFLKDALESDGFQITGATSGSAGLELVKQLRPRLVLLDLMLPDVSGLELLDQILAIDPGIDVILLTGHYSTESAVEAIQKGAYDYITKPVAVEKLLAKLTKWAEDANLRQQAKILDSQLIETYRFQGIVGRSPLMLEIFSKIRRIAPHFETALIVGATGTGKELVAKALHDHSPRASGPFITCNCAALAESLFESELFGYVRGAFTGAVADKQGIVEAARGGTLFLDEVGEVPLHVQAKLLRLIQNREIQRLGATTPKHADVHIIAATNRNLRQMARENQFREDLYYRMNLVELALPRLADRKEDLALLQQHFLAVYSAKYGKPRLNLTRRAQAILSRYPWPGNVRELENVLASCCMMVERNCIDARDLPSSIQDDGSTSSERESDFVTMGEMEKRYASQVLAHCNGNRVRAAEVLGISRSTLYRLFDSAKTAPRSWAESGAAENRISGFGARPT